MTDLFTPDIGSAGEFVFQANRPVSDNTVSTAVSQIGNLVGGLFQNAQLPGSSETEAQFQRRARADFTNEITKAQASNDPARIRALVRKGSTIFGNDEWFQATVQQYTGFNVANNINPNTALISQYQKLMEERPLIAAASAVVREDGTVDPQASLEQFMVVINAEASNQLLLQANRNTELGNWLTQLKPRVEMAIQTKVAQVSSLVQNLTASGQPITLEQLNTFQSEWNAERAVLVNAIPASLPAEERSQLFAAFDAVDNFITAMKTDEQIFDSAVSSAESRAFLGFVNSLQDPALKSMALLYGTEQFRDYADIMNLQQLSNPETMKSIMTALAKSAEQTPLFNSPRLSSPVTSTPTPTVNYDSMSTSEILSGPVLEEAMNTPAASRFNTAEANASALQTFTEEMWASPSKIQTGTAFAVQALAQLSVKEGFNYAPKLQQVFTSGFLTNLKRLYQANPEDAPAVQALVTKTVGQERLRHRTEINNIVRSNPRLIINPDTGVVSLDFEEHLKFAGLTAEAVEYLSNQDPVFRESTERFLNGTQDLMQWVNENPATLVERVLETLGFGLTLESEVRLLKKHIDTIDYLNTLEGQLPKVDNTTTSTPLSLTATVSPEVLAVAEGLLPFIDATESTGNYNAYLYNADNKTLQFTSMTVDQVLEWQNTWRKANNTPSAAVGRYQIIETTLRGLKEELNLSGNELFSPQLQDRLFLQLVKRRMGQGVTGFRNEWEGFKGVDTETLRGIVG